MWNWVSNLSLRTRLILYLLVGIMPILAVTIFFAWEMHAARRNQVLLSHMAIAQATSGTVAEFIQGIVQAHDVISVTIVREDMTPEEITGYFGQIRGQIPLLETIGFALPTGEVVSGVPRELIGVNISDRRYFQEIAEGLQWQISELLEVRPTGEPGFIIAHRVEAVGEFAGMVFSAISLAALEGFVIARVDPAVEYSILDQRGNIIASTILPRELIPAERNRSWIPSVQEALQGQPTVAQPFLDRADGVWRMGASVPVPVIGWVVNIFAPVDTAMAPVRRAVYVDIALHLFVFAVLVAIAWIAATRLSEQIILLADKARAVARGDFTQRMSIPDRAEIGALAGAFNDMTANLERLSAEEQRARHNAVFLADISEILTSTLNPDVILQTVTERTSAFMADIVAVANVDEDGNLRMLGMHARDPELGKRLQSLVGEHPPKVPAGVVGKAVEENRSIYVRRVSDLTEPQTRYYLERLNAVSTIAVPISVYGQTAGALSITSVTQELTEQDLSIAEELARRLGIALGNVRLYQEALARADFERGLSDLAAAMASTLDPESVLQAICTGAMNLMRVDGVYIWMLEEDEDKLIDKEACGCCAADFFGLELSLDDPESGAVKAISSGSAFYRHDVQATGIAGLMGELFHAESDLFQPLISAGRPLGVMIMTDTHDPQRFDEGSLSQAGLIAGYAATAVANARAYMRERRIAETLQRGLLPEVPETIDSLELAHFYTPARREAEIGGDFYDWIEFPLDIYGLVIGDVSGKGLEAAVVTAMVKYVLRAYTAEDPEPPEVLAKVNNAVVQYTSPDMFITVLYGVLDPGSRRFRFVSAGHEPILVYRDSGKKVSFETPMGLAAGISGNQEYLSREISLDPGDLMLLYTDGLTDARSPQGEFLGHDQLAVLVSELASLPAQEFVKALMERVRDYTGGEFTDDVALMVVRAARQ